jgi:choline dehydrogenase-like flavoprotein
MSDRRHPKGGNVTIKSNNIFDPPTINPNFLDSDFDMFVMREAIRSVRKFAKAPAFSDYILSLVNNATSDDELDQFIRSSAVTVSHGVGTAAMSPKGAEYGVVDPDLCVKNISGLRAIDASVLVSYSQSPMGVDDLRSFAADGPSCSYSGGDLRCG